MIISYEVSSLAVFESSCSRVIPCQLSQPVNPPFQIFLKFNKHLEVFMLIPTNIFLKIG